jgi:hypothetical protein
MRKAIAALLAAVLLIFSACGENITEGVVTNKVYVPASSHIIMYPMLVGKVTVMMPMSVFDPEEWILVLKNCEQTGAEECTEGQIRVSSETWNSTNVGDRYP